jgi:hypothetical protein
MPAHRPFFIVRNPGTGAVKKVGYASVEDGMQQILLTDGSLEAALDHPKAVFERGPEPKRSGRKRRHTG